MAFRTPRREAANYETHLAAGHASFLLGQPDAAIAELTAAIELALYSMKKHTSRYRLARVSHAAKHPTALSLFQSVIADTFSTCSAWRFCLGLMVCLWAASLQANPLGPWQWRNPLPNGTRLTAGAYGAGVFVAVGSTGLVMTSPDGTSWLTQYLGNPGGNCTFMAVTYAAGQFLASAMLTNSVYGVVSVVLASPDGTNWNGQLLVNEVLSGFAYGNDTFVAVRYSSGLRWSTDGMTWGWPSANINRHFKGVAFGTNQFVAVGDGGVIATSSDGNVWTSQRSGTTLNLTAITFASNRFVAVGQTGIILTSTDAINWTAQPNPSWDGLSDLQTVSYGNGQFVAGGGTRGNASQPPDGGIVTSPDGVHWTSRTVPRTFQLNGIVFATNRFLAFGERGTIAYSDNAVTWTSVTSGPTDTLCGIASGKGLLVAVGGYFYGGYGYAVLSSPDGLTWSRRASTSDFLLMGVTYGNNQFVAVGPGGLVVTSPDGNNWTKRSPGTDDDLHGVAYGLGQFVAVGQDGHIWGSTDGVRWSARLSGAGQMLNCVTYGNGLFVASGWRGTVFTSPDSTNWTSQHSGTTNDLNGIACGTNGFVAVGNSGGVFWSPDGTNWSSKPPELNPYLQSMRSVAYVNGTYVVVGDQGTVITSPDGLTWNTPILTTDNNLFGITPWQRGFIAVGQDGAILQSSEITILPPRLGPIVLLANGQAQVTVTAAAGQSYFIQGSSDLINWVTFTNLTLTNATGWFLDPDAPGFRARFYRAGASF